MAREPGELGGSSQTHDIFNWTPDGGWKARTYGLTLEIIQRIDRIALELEVGQSDLVRFLLDYALNAAEAGQFEIKTKHLPGKVIDKNWS